MFIQLKGEIKTQIGNDDYYNDLYWDIGLNSNIIEGVIAPYLNEDYFTVILKKNNRFYSSEDSTRLVCSYDNYEEAKTEYDKLISLLCKGKVK